MNDSDRIIHLAGRAHRIAKQLGHNIPVMDLAISLSVAHAKQPLDLENLNSFPDGDFGHDVFGIHRHLDRLSGDLKDCFVPRCGFAKATA